MMPRSCGDKLFRPDKIQIQPDKIILFYSLLVYQISFHHLPITPYPTDLLRHIHVLIK